MWYWPLPWTWTGWDDPDYRYEPTPLFEQSFRCLPFDIYKNPSLESGNKIIMPQSCLDRLAAVPISFPLFFKIHSAGKTSYCIVLKFGAEEGFVYMPRWMMKNLGVEEGGSVTLRDATLSKAYYMKLQLHTAAFMKLPDPKAVLGTALRAFACVSAGDTIVVKYNEREFFIDVVEVKPGGEAASLIETDCTVEFAPSLDSVEMSEREGSEEREEKDERGGVKEFRPFAGMARRIDGTAVVVAEGKKKREKDGGKVEEREIKKGGGERKEVRVVVPVVEAERRQGGAVESGGGEGKEREKDEGKEKFKAFTGKSRVLGGNQGFLFW